MAETFVSMMLCDPSELTSVSALSTSPSSPELWEALGDGERLDRRLSYGSCDCSWENSRARSQGVESHVISTAPVEGTLSDSPDPLAAHVQQMNNESAESLDSSLYTTALDLGDPADVASGLPDSPLVGLLATSLRRLEVTHSSQNSTGADTTAVTEANGCRPHEGNTLGSNYCSQLPPVVTPPTPTPPSDVTISVPAPDIPPAVAQLTNEQLRSRLVELGEEPGPVNPFTRHAYLNYLTKLLAGVQPTGNKGYKGQHRGSVSDLHTDGNIKLISAFSRSCHRNTLKPMLLVVRMSPPPPGYHYEHVSSPPRLSL